MYILTAYVTSGLGKPLSIQEIFCDLFHVNTLAVKLHFNTNKTNNLRYCRLGFC